MTRFAAVTCLAILIFAPRTCTAQQQKDATQSKPTLISVKVEAEGGGIAIRLHSVPTIDGLPPEPEYHDERNVDLILQPTIWVRPWNLALPVSDFIPVHAGTAFLYFYGYVDYMDFGERRRQTRFCFLYTILSSFNPDPSGFYPAANVLETYTRCT